jgi:hypothetical protein
VFPVMKNSARIECVCPAFLNHFLDSLKKSFFGRGGAIESSSEKKPGQEEKRLKGGAAVPPPTTRASPEGVGHP